VRVISRLLLAALAIALFSTPAVAQLRRDPVRVSGKAQGDRPELGPQAGFATNNLDFFIGAQFAYPVANRFDFYPSFDYYFADGPGTIWALNADIRWWPKINVRNPGLYAGGGLNYSHFSFSGFSNSEVGLGLLGGWEFKASNVHPFGQIKIVIGDADRVEFGGGINFRL
jgi:hypothetical protein